MPSVHARTRSDGEPVYRVHFRDAGKQRAKTFANAKGAEQFASLIDRVGAPAAIAVWQTRQGRDASVPTFGEWIDTYLDSSSGHLTGIERGTRDGYKNIAAKSLVPILGDIPVDSITEADIGRWIAWQERQESGRRKGQKVAAKTVRNYHALLSSVLAAAVKAKLRGDNPAKGARVTRGQKHQAVFLSHEEFYTLLHFIPAYYKPLVRFLVLTGTRWSEATALQKRDVNMDSNPPTVNVSKAWKKGNTIGPPKTEKGYRLLPLRPDLGALLDVGGDGGDFLFQGAANGGRVWYGPFKTRIWDKAVAKAMDAEECKKVGRPRLPRRPTPHDLRHTYASWLIAKGAPLNLVQRNLGHEKITTTVDTYGHLSPTAHEDTVAALYEALPEDRPELATDAAGELPEIEA